MVEREPPLGPIAVDVTGTLYEHDGTAFREVARSALNDGCMPPCVSFSASAVKKDAGAVSMVLGGSRAQVMTVESDSAGEVSLGGLDAVSAVLFANEGRDAEMPVRFTSVAFAPDGALWLGTQLPFLVRVSPDRSEAKRICLPKDARGAEVSAIEPHASGRLYLGMAPALLGFGDWRE
jgi:hypothetical protein